MRIRGGHKQRRGCGSGRIVNCGYDSEKPAVLFRAKRCNRGAHQLLHVGPTLHILDRQRARGAITDQSLLFTTKLCIEVSARQLKYRVRRVLFNEWAEDVERLFILLIVTMRIQRKIKAGNIGSENALRDGVLKQAHSVLFRTSRDTHEKSQNLGYGA